jgi:hypothetical protein
MHALQVQVPLDASDEEMLKDRVVAEIMRR